MPNKNQLVMLEFNVLTCQRTVVVAAIGSAPHPNTGIYASGSFVPSLRYSTETRTVSGGRWHSLAVVFNCLPQLSLWRYHRGSPVHSALQNSLPALIGAFVCQPANAAFSLQDNKQCDVALQVFVPVARAREHAQH